MKWSCQGPKPTGHAAVAPVKLGAPRVCVRQRVCIFGTTSARMNFLSRPSPPRGRQPSRKRGTAQWFINGRERCSTCKGTRVVRRRRRVMCCQTGGERQRPRWQSTANQEVAQGQRLQALPQSGAAMISVSPLCILAAPHIARYPLRHGEVPRGPQTPVVGYMQLACSGDNALPSM